MDQRTYLHRHLPPGCRSGHSLLYDFDGEFAAWRPTVDEVNGCITDLVPIVARVQIAQELYSDGHDASELALAVIAIARHHGLPRPRGATVDELCLHIDRVIASSPWETDASKRLDGIRALLRQGRWNEY